MLSLLYTLALTTPLLFWPGAPRWAAWLGLAGMIALAGLLLRLALVGFTGYERLVGLRIIRRKGSEAGSRGRRLLVVFWASALTSVLLLLAINALVEPGDSMLTTLQPLRVGLVFYTAGATFGGLLTLISRRFSIFGTTSIIGVVLGVAALLVVQSVATGFQHEFERRVLGVYAHINVTRAFGISEYRRFEAWTRTIDGVEGASPFVYLGMALAPFTGEGRGVDDVKLASVLVKGIEPSTAAEVIDLPDHLVRGSGREIPLSELRSDYQLMPVPDRPDTELPLVIAQTPDPRGEDWYDAAIAEWNAGDHRDDPFRVGRRSEDEDVWEDPPEDLDAVAQIDIDDTNLPTMFIGVGLARELKLAEGDVVRLVDPGATFDHSEAPKFVYYRIAGVFQAGFQEYDSRLVYVDIRELQRFKYRGKDIVSGVDLRLREQSLAPEVGAVIRGAINSPEIAEYSVLEWQKLNENLFDSIRTQKNIITVILSLVIFVASFNVLSALWTMVIRRTPEVAIIMSMGATGPQVARIFQVTGMTIGLAGSLAGVIFGLVMCGLVQLYGYTLDPEVYFIEELPVEIDPVQIAWILGLALAFCFIATIPPSLRAARQRPVEGLRYE
ncbi:hypothetical protein PPSIR1_04323 [Plesiocystis pacifica SIR-1]|uniref:ABC3 transporter permease C-terminal domain-containing protein n=1 Tax=Plesiocystis pacifica SIR-1 TaxID=391625 RepID=A6GFE6_9BACT|nr:ABC transporter permease [Plesiocystis pacifica]EDM75431.1 hypothetical protein PPSIR1_04323 [Plesiocystis pacifica SIR-1]